MLAPLSKPRSSLSLGWTVREGTATCPLTCVHCVCALLDMVGTLQRATQACHLQRACWGLDRDKGEEQSSVLFSIDL